MNEEYLWDKSGEPDPDIQELEQILGVLRYEPKPLDLGAEVEPPRRYRYLPLIAIAATLLIALVAGGLWLITRSKTTPQLQNAGLDSPAIPHLSPPPVNDKSKDLAANHSKHNSEPIQIVRTTHPKVLRRSNMTIVERQQAVEAKQQLMTALRLASEKLNLAQRKAQGASPNQIRNQHKIG
ncbi:MAG TPA: hypothetical protein VLE19_08330 [Pyrinomonadaceae bacterium]|nr:hypothetical protein [Pyrinomonadaceae bacterium]